MGGGLWPTKRPPPSCANVPVFQHGMRLSQEPHSDVHSRFFTMMIFFSLGKARLTVRLTRLGMTYGTTPFHDDELFSTSTMLAISLP